MTTVMSGGGVSVAPKVRRLVKPCSRDIVGHTILLVDLSLNVKVDARNDEIGNNVEGADAIENVRVIEGNLLGDLHEPPV